MNDKDFSYSLGTLLGKPVIISWYSNPTGLSRFRVMGVSPDFGWIRIQAIIPDSLEPVDGGPWWVQTREIRAIQEDISIDTSPPLLLQTLPYKTASNVNLGKVMLNGVSVPSTVEITDGTVVITTNDCMGGQNGKDSGVS